MKYFICLSFILGEAELKAESFHVYHFYIKEFPNQITYEKLENISPVSRTLISFNSVVFSTLFFHSVLHVLTHQPQFTSSIYIINELLFIF